MRRTPLRRGAPPRRRAALARTTPLRRVTPLKRSAIAPASPAQRDKVRGRRCLVCGADRAVDPAHLVPRSLGGCDDPDCVVALCRTHHRAYDRGEFDLLPHLEPDHRAEAAHAVAHLGLIGALRRLGAQRPTAAESAVPR